MANERELKFVITAEDKASKEFKKVQKQLEATSKKMSSVGKTMSLAITAPFVLAAGLMTKAAIDAEEVKNKFNVVFRSVSSDADKVAQDLRDNYGLARSSAEDLLSATGDMLTGFGLTGAVALDLAEKTNKLAVDLASFTNIQGGARRASVALTKALLGERESVKELGIAILEEDVKAKVKSLEATGQLTNETMRQKKAIATLEIAYEQSKNAIGDFARTQGSAANQLRVLKERLKEVSEVFGTQMIPVATEMIKAASSLIKGFSDISDTTKKVIFIFGTFIATLGPSIFIIGKVIQAFAALRAALIATRVATLALLGPWGAAIAIAGTLATVVGFKLFSSVDATTDAIEKLKRESEELDSTLSPELVGGIDSVSDAFGEMGADAKKATEDLEKLKKGALDALKDFRQDEASSSRDLAEASIEQQEKVARLTDELLIETRKAERDRDKQKIRELTETLGRETQALRDMKFIRIQFANEIAEAQRRSSLTEFERRVEDILRERRVNLEQHVEKLKLIFEELQAAVKKNAAIATSYAAAQASIRSETEKTTMLIISESAKQEKAIFKVVSSLSMLEAAHTTIPLSPRLRLLGGQAFGSDFIPRTGAYLLHKGEQVVQAGRAVAGGGITINITGTFLSETVAEDIGNVIVKKLNRTMKLS